MSLGSLQKFILGLAEYSPIGQAYLAFGSSDGGVGLIKIIQSAHPKSFASSFEPEYSIQTLFEIQDNHLYEADKCGITALEWLNIPGRGVSGWSYEHSYGSYHIC